MTRQQAFNSIHTTTFAESCASQKRHSAIPNKTCIASASHYAVMPASLPRKPRITPMPAPHARSKTSNATFGRDHLGIHENKRARGNERQTRSRKMDRAPNSRASTSGMHEERHVRQKSVGSSRWKETWMGCKKSHKTRGVPITPDARKSTLCAVTRKGENNETKSKHSLQKLEHTRIETIVMQVTLPLASSFLLVCLCLGGCGCARGAKVWK